MVVGFGFLILDFGSKIVGFGEGCPWHNSIIEVLCSDVHVVFVKFLRNDSILVKFFIHYFLWKIQNKDLGMRL